MFHRFIIVDFGGWFASVQWDVAWRLSLWSCFVPKSKNDWGRRYSTNESVSKNNIISINYFSNYWNANWLNFNCRLEQDVRMLNLERTTKSSDESTHPDPLLRPYTSLVHSKWRQSNVKIGNKFSLVFSTIGFRQLINTAHTHTYSHIAVESALRVIFIVKTLPFIQVIIKHIK